MSGPWPQDVPTILGELERRVRDLASAPPDVLEAPGTVERALRTALDALVQATQALPVVVAPHASGAAQLSAPGARSDAAIPAAAPAVPLPRGGTTPGPGGSPSELADAIQHADLRRVRHVAALMSDRPDVPPVARRAAAAIADGDWVRGLPLLAHLQSLLTHQRRGSADQPGAAAAALLAARIELSRREVLRAEGHLVHALAAAGDTGRYEAVVSAIHRAQDQESTGLALDAAQRATELEPGLPRAHVELAVTTRASGGDPSAHLQRAVDTALTAADPLAALADLVAPVPPPAFLLLARALLDRGDGSPGDAASGAWRERALAVLELLLSDDPLVAAGAEWPAGDAERESVLAEAYELRAGLQEDDVEASVRDLYEAAVHWMAVGDAVRVRGLLGRVLEVRPDHGDARVVLADSLRILAAGAEDPQERKRLSAEAELAWVASEGHTSEVGPGWRARVLAAIEEARGDDDGRPVVERLCRAGLVVERAMLEDPDDGWCDIVAGRLLRRLGLVAASRATLEAACARGGLQGSLAAEELVTLLVNAGDHDAGLVALDRLEEDDWAVAVRAWVDITTGRDTDSGVAGLQAVHAHGSEEPWQRSAAAVGLHLLGRETEAREVLGELWERRALLVADGDFLEAATAALRLGHFRYAREVLQACSPDPVDVGRVRALQLMSALALGEDVAPGALAATLAASPSSDTLGPGIEWDLDVVEEAVVQRDDGARAGRLLEVTRAREVATGPARPLATAGDPVGELRAAAADAHAVAGADAPVPAGHAATAATFLRMAAGRLLLRDGATADAAAEYQSIDQDAHEEAGESVAAGLRAVSRVLVADADAAIAGADTPDQVAPGIRALAVLEEAGVALDAAADAAVEADGSMRSAVEARRVLLRGAGPERDPQAMAAAVQRLVAAAGERAAAELATVLDRWVELRRRPSLLALLRKTAADTGQAASAVMDAVEDHVRDSAVAAIRGEPSAVAADGRPLVLELGDALIPEDTGPGWKLFAEDLPGLRARIRQRTGVVIPGTRVRPGSDLEPLQYRIVLQGLPEQMGRIEVADTTTGSDTTGSDTPGSDTTGSPAEMLHGAMAALEAVLLRSLDVVIRLDHVAVQVEDPDRDIDGWYADIALLAETVPDTTSELRFVRLMRRLARARVPIGNWQSLLRLAAEVGALADDDIEQAVVLVRPHLPAPWGGSIPAPRTGQREELRRGSSVRTPAQAPTGAAGAAMGGR
jgi:hypothetical protein